jgi:hypothetical protein
MGEVYLGNENNEKLFAQGVKGAQDAPWIVAGTNYEFRLYAAADHSKVLAKVVVTRAGTTPASETTAGSSPIP